MKKNDIFVKKKYALHKPKSSISFEGVLWGKGIKSSLTTVELCRHPYVVYHQVHRHRDRYFLFQMTTYNVKKIKQLDVVDGENTKVFQYKFRHKTMLLKGVAVVDGKDVERTFRRFDTKKVWLGGSYDTWSTSSVMKEVKQYIDFHHNAFYCYDALTGGKTDIRLPKF